MNRHLKYAPVFRGRQEEMRVLRMFNFGKSIYPCLEIVKEIDRRPTKSKSSSTSIPKRFEDVYLPLIKDIKAEKVFVDLPVHIAPKRSMTTDVLDFLTKVVRVREVRTEYMLKFRGFKDKVIPVVSTYFNVSNEASSIIKQENVLRQEFPVIAFRTFMGSFSNDLQQIKKVAQESDFVIMDWRETELDLNDGDIADTLEGLKALKCAVVVHRNPIPNGIKNKELVQDTVVTAIDNNLIYIYPDFAGNCFSDYAGIKPGDLKKGGGSDESQSPGFLYYDATQNQFFGYRGNILKWSELGHTIVPAVLASKCTERMTKDRLGYLCSENNGWTILNQIHEGVYEGNSPARFKFIAMYHYLHCIKTKIEDDYFDS